MTLNFRNKNYVSEIDAAIKYTFINKIEYNISYSLCANKFDKS